MKVKKWEQDQTFFAKVSFFDSNDEEEYIIKSKTKNDFNKKISNLLTNCLLKKN